MAKKNGNQPALVIKDANGTVVTKIRKSTFTTIPVDFETKNDLILLCVASGGSKRSQGAMVKRLVKEALAKAQKNK